VRGESVKKSDCPDLADLTDLQDSLFSLWGVLSIYLSFAVRGQAQGRTRPGGCYCGIDMFQGCKSRYTNCEACSTVCFQVGIDVLLFPRYDRKGYGERHEKATITQS